MVSSGLPGFSSSLGYSVLPSIRTIEAARMATRRCGWAASSLSPSGRGARLFRDSPQ
jgi:hypothetical protein